MFQFCDGKHLLNLPHLPGNFDDSNYVDVIQNLAPHFNDTFIQCYFRDYPNECKDIFTPIITEVGLCYTFNGLPGREIYRTSEYRIIKFI